MILMDHAGPLSCLSERVEISELQETTELWSDPQKRLALGMDRNWMLANRQIVHRCSTENPVSVPRRFNLLDEVTHAFERQAGSYQLCIEAPDCAPPLDHRLNLIPVYQFAQIYPGQRDKGKSRPAFGPVSLPGCTVYSRVRHQPSSLATVGARRPFLPAVVPLAKEGMHRMLPSFETNRLLLGSRSLVDLDACLAMNSDPDVMRYFGGMPTNIDDYIATQVTQISRRYPNGLGYWSLFATQDPPHFWAGVSLALQ